MSSLFPTRQEQILERFAAFHRANPHVFEFFTRFALQVIDKGYTRYSSDCICHRIRWHVGVDQGDMDFALNDHYTAYYARLFMLARPEHIGLFETRTCKSKNRPAGTSESRLPPDEGNGQVDEFLRGLIPPCVPLTE